jgi:hypothetical protein
LDPAEVPGRINLGAFEVFLCDKRKLFAKDVCKLIQGCNLGNIEFDWVTQGPFRLVPQFD